MHIEIIKAFFLSYLLIPSLLVVLVIPLGILKRNMPLIKTKVLVLYVLLSGLLLALPGVLGFAGHAFNPYCYLIASVCYLCFGLLHLSQVLKRFYGSEVPLSIRMSFEIILTVLCQLLGVYLFTYVFDFFSPFKGYGLVSASCSMAYLIPLFFYYSYRKFLQIPFSIYKTWTYENHRPSLDFDGVDLNQLKVVTLELSKDAGEGNQARIKAKALFTGINFGDWFQKVLEDYNLKNGNSNIEIHDTTGIAYTWIFYVKRSLFHFRYYIDFELDMENNKIKENDVIICKRVVENKQTTKEWL